MKSCRDEVTRVLGVRAILSFLCTCDGCIYASAAHGTSAYLTDVHAIH